jgi:serpin B
MYRLLASLLAAPALALALLGPAEGQAPAKLSADARTAAQGNNVFALDLYARLREKEGNLFFSPYSISTALAMTYAGARGDTAEQMRTTLHFALPPQRLHPAFGELIRHFNAAGPKRKYQLDTANALWAQKGYTFLPDFLRLTNKVYEAGLKEVDFRQTEQARKTINAWVEKQTRDKIKDLFAPGVLQPDTRLVLTNAIYFKGDWATPFPKGATQKQDFQLGDGKKVKVPMMLASKKLRYYGDKTVQVVALPYGGHELEMVVLLPGKVDGLGELEKGLASARLDEWLKGMGVRRVDLFLPKFKLLSAFSLNQQLSEMGMPLAFTERADFSGMSTREKLFIGKVVHKAFVDVNEKGTEAAAATGVTIQPTSAPLPEKSVVFRADHPFLFLIRDHRTGSILFMGRLANPQ